MQEYALLSKPCLFGHVCQVEKCGNYCSTVLMQAGVCMVQADRDYSAPGDWLRYCS